MDEDQSCMATLPGRMQLPDTKGTTSIQSYLHFEEKELKEKYKLKQKWDNQRATQTSIFIHIVANLPHI